MTNTHNYGDDLLTMRRKKIAANLRRFFWGIIILAAFWLIFGQLLPQLLFAPTQSPVKPAATSSSAIPLEPSHSSAPTTASTHSDAIAMMLERLDALEMALATLPSKSDNVSDEKLAELEEKIENIIQNHSADSLPNDASFVVIDDMVNAQQERISALEAKLDALSRAIPQQQEKLIALRRLEAALYEGIAYQELLLPFHAVSTQTPAAQEAFATLSGFAKTGIPRLAFLQKEFQMLIPDLLHSKKSNAGLLDNVSSLVTIRKVGEAQTGNDTQAIIARAEAKLEHGEVEGALVEMQSISKGASPSLSRWQEHANAYITARAALLVLEQAMFAPVAVQP